MKNSGGSKALSAVINETNNTIKKLEGKYGTVKYENNRSRWSIVPLATQTVTLNNSNYEKAQKRTLAHKKSLEDFVQTLKQIY